MRRFWLNILLGAGAVLLAAWLLYDLVAPVLQGTMNSTMTLIK